MAISSRSVFTNLIWRFAERCGAQFVSFIVTIVLARILDPEVYGTIALVSVITTILWVFVDSGLANALIQRKDADDLDFSTVFFFNIGFCTILYILLFLAAPLISLYYGIPQLTPVVRVLGISLLLSSVKNVQQAYISRQLLFKKFFFATLGGTIGSGIIGITMALFGCGVWSLVASTLFNSLIDAIVLWVTVKWRPKLMFSWKRLKNLYSYGWKLLVSCLLDSLYNNLIQLIIGKVYSKADLAYYNKGQQIPNLVIGNIDSSINSVILPVMAGDQDNPEQIKRIAKRSLKINFYTMSPLLVGIAAVADPLVRIVYTDKWISAVPFIQLVCLVQVFRPIHTTNLNALKAVGRSDLFLKLEIIKKIVGFTAIFVLMRYGVMALAFALVVDNFFSIIINSWNSKKLFDYGLLEQLKDIVPTLFLSSVMGATVYMVNYLMIANWLKLVIQIPLGMFIYVMASWITKMESFRYELDLIRKLFRKKDDKAND